MEAADLGLRVEHLDGTDGRRLNTEAATTGFCETREVVFTAPAELEGDLFLDDERLLRDGSENRWKWRPGFYAGEVRAEFVDPTGQSLGVFRLDVSPDPKKLGADTFARMLGEIAAFDPRLLEGSEPARHPLGPLGEESNPVVAFVRLRRREEAIRRALADIRAQPIRGLRARRDLVPLTRMRRVDHRTVERALSHPATRALVLGQMSSDGEIVAPGGDPNPRFDVPAVERKLDTPPNRAALAMLLALSRRCSEVAERLRSLEHAKTADAATGLSGRVPRWIEILERFRRDLERTRRALPFSEVKRPGFKRRGTERNCFPPTLRPLLPARLGGAAAGSQRSRPEGPAAAQPHLGDLRALVLRRTGWAATAFASRFQLDDCREGRPTRVAAGEARTAGRTLSCSCKRPQAPPTERRSSTRSGPSRKAVPARPRAAVDGRRRLLRVRGARCQIPRRTRPHTRRNDGIGSPLPERAEVG